VSAQTFFISRFALSFAPSAFPDKSFLAFMREHNVLYIGREYHFRFAIHQSNFRYMTAARPSRSPPTASPASSLSNTVCFLARADPFSRHPSHRPYRFPTRRD
jgi:hypothetical protein